ncbi:MAG: hypothetical protein GKR88_07725 [Flavobacteriaceae bacterium]|nr:MAG: hypothetical protein GKR88_07725 [Flavobacteriaceae bacterium]
MKKILTIFLLLLSTYAIAQDNKKDFIEGEYTFHGTVTNHDVTIDYRAKVKYSATLFGGIKVNATITEFEFWNLRYKGKLMSDAVYKKLGIKTQNGGGIKPNKSSLFNFATTIRFFFPPNFIKDTYDVEFVWVGWGTFDEYTYLKDSDVKKIRSYFNIKKENLEDFYKLSIFFRDLQITDFNMPIIEEIKTAMDEEIADKKDKIRKLEELKKLYPNEKLNLSQLNRKVSLLRDVIDQGYTNCYGYHTCHRALANAQNEIAEREKKGEKEDKTEEKEAVAEKEEDSKNDGKNTEEQQRLAQEQKRKQAEAQRKATEAKKKAEQQRRAVAERKRKKEAKRKVKEKETFIYYVFSLVSGQKIEYGGGDIYYIYTKIQKIKSPKIIKIHSCSGRYSMDDYGCTSAFEPIINDERPYYHRDIREKYNLIKTFRFRTDVYIFSSFEKAKFYRKKWTANNKYGVKIEDNEYELVFYKNRLR